MRNRKNPSFLHFVQKERILNSNSVKKYTKTGLFSHFMAFIGNDTQNFYSKKLLLPKLRGLCYTDKSKCPPGHPERNGKTMKRMFALILAFSLLLCACGSKPAETTAPPETTVPPTTVPVTTAPPETTVPPTTEATEPPPVDTNPLTGEALDAVSDSRPYAIMINNTTKAVPQCGISQADMIYEIVAEGSVTRFMAIFDELSDVDVIGPVRSVRPYFYRVAQHYGAILTSAGGSDEADSLIKKEGYNRLDGIAGAGSAFYRDQWRRENKGFEHSLMTTGEKLAKAAEKAGFKTTTESSDYGLSFTADTMTTGETADQITVWFYKNGKKTVMNYNGETGLYAMYQHGADSVDGNDKSPITFRNVVVLEADTHVKDKKGHLETQMTGTGKGYYARDGKIIPIQWSRESNSAKYVYTDLEGNPISFGIGKTYVAIVPDGSPFSYK